LQRVGLNAVVNLRLALARGEEPGRTLLDAACFALGGFLLTIPGFISDLMAFALFLPWTRNYLLRRVARHFDVHVHTGLHAGFGTRPAQRGPESRTPESATSESPTDIIDGEYSVVEPEPPVLDTPRKQD
jgi:UPF0716 protein FxsA